MQINKLFHNIKIGNFEGIEDCLIKGLSTNVKDRRGWSSLHYAARNGSIEITKLLMKYNANINTKTDFGVKPIHIAALFGRKNLVEFFILQGLNVDDSDNKGWTPLHYASWSGRIDTIKLLISNGANVNAVNNEQKRPLDLANESGYNEICGLFEIKSQPKTYLDKILSYVSAYVSSIKKK